MLIFFSFFKIYLNLKEKQTHTHTGTRDVGHGATRALTRPKVTHCGKKRIRSNLYSGCFIQGFAILPSMPDVVQLLFAWTHHVLWSHEGPQARPTVPPHPPTHKSPLLWLFKVITVRVWGSPEGITAYSHVSSACKASLAISDHTRPHSSTQRPRCWDVCATAMLQRFYSAFVAQGGRPKSQLSLKYSAFFPQNPAKSDYAKS